MLISRNTMRAFGVALMALVLAACAGIPAIPGSPASAPFDQLAYQNAANVKAQALALIDRAGEKYATRRAEAEALIAEIDRAYSYAQSRPNNQIATQAWEVIRNPQGGSVVAYVRTWQQRGSLPPAFRLEKRRQLAGHLDYVVCIEANKQTPTACGGPPG